MDDVISQGWTLDPETARALRLDHVRKLVERMSWDDAALEAEELLDEAPEHVEALELLAHAQAGMMDAEGAVQTWEQLLRLDPTPRADRLAALSLARLDSCDLVGSVEAARESIRLDPALADAHFVMGFALDRLPGNATESARALIAANRLDPLAYPFPLRLDAESWEQALTTAMMHVAPEVRSLWEGVPVRLPQAPDLEMLRANDPPLSPRIPGLFLGEPPEDGDPWLQPPEGLLLFTQNLARVQSLEELIERLADVLEQEALVWLGQDPWDGDDIQLEEL
ncbi:MAG: hypothetical protein AB8H79_07255 [Myxococcota bacterium]